MDAYIKSFKDFKTRQRAQLLSYDMPLETTENESGRASLAIESSECLGEWLFIFDKLVLVSQASPKNGSTDISTVDPILAFDRECVCPSNSETTYGAFIKAAIERDYVSCSDSFYAMPYITVTNADSTSMPPLELNDTKLYKLSDVMSEARRVGVRIDFELKPTSLHINIYRKPNDIHGIVFNDGHSQLTAVSYSAETTAKVTVLQELAKEDGNKDAPKEYVAKDYYLGTDETATAEIPTERITGKWLYTSCVADDDPAERAQEIFDKNIQSHKIEFMSDKKLELYDDVILRFDSKILKSKIVYIGRSSGDTRCKYKCGELPVTLTDKIKRGSK